MRGLGCVEVVTPSSSWRQDSSSIEAAAVAPAKSRVQISSEKSLAFIGSVSAREADARPDADTETLSITRLEGRRWRGGRLWSWNLDLPRWTVASGRAVGTGGEAAWPGRVAGVGPECGARAAR